PPPPAPAARPATPTPLPAPARPVPAAADPVTRTRARPAAALKPPRTAPASEPTAAPRGAQLRLIAFYPFESGHLSLWLDGALYYETALEARITKKVVVAKVRDGRLEQALSITPGKHR